MISMFWISQAALRFADSDLITTILFGLILMWIVVSFRCFEEISVTGLFHLITGFLCFRYFSFWNNNTQCQDERKAMNPKKEKKKEIPTPVLVDEDKKKKSKRNKRYPRKIVSKENKEPTVLKERTKMYSSLETCQRLNKNERSIFEDMSKYCLTLNQLLINNFPTENYRPQTLVEAGNNFRSCVRCNEQFEIYNGLYLSSTKCSYHPRKATFSVEYGIKIYACCKLPIESPPCSVANHHVTNQHGPRQMTKTPSRRHIRKDLQNRIYGMDCEMSYTTGGLEVTRIGVVDINGLTVYDSYVKPKNKILDYNTLYSGVEKRHLEHINITTDDAKKILNTFIHEDTILVGHALNNDLAALGLIHNTVVDTSVLYPNPVCPMKKRSLKSLASQFLGVSIQDDPNGHDCIEDARTCLQLALLKVPPNPFYPVENFTSGQTRQQNLVENEDLFYEQEQQQPLMEIQNLIGSSGANSFKGRVQHDQRINFSPMTASAKFNPYDPNIYRYDPSFGFYRCNALCHAN